MSIYNTIARVDWTNPGDILSTATSLTKATKSVIGKIKSLSSKQKHPSFIRDSYTNGFYGTNESVFKPDFFSRMFDEPTYLSFRVEFEPGEGKILNRNISPNNMGLGGGYTDATYATSYDYLPEPFLQDYKKTIGDNRTYTYRLEDTVIVDDLTGEETRFENTVDTQLSENPQTGTTYSTESYLYNQLGEYERSYMLGMFKRALRDIQTNFPYYFKSIKGLQKLSTVKPTQGARLKDAKITIECEEGLDMKITQLLQLYRKIVWDDVYQRWVLPDMMRYFSMKIYVSEIRLFHDIKFDNKTTGLYDFNDTDVRNMVQYPPNSKERTIDKISKYVRTVESLSNAYLGTKSTLAKVMNTVTGTYNTVMDIWSSITTGSENMVNNVINDVMPTICYECHMCEFDIGETMSHIDSLSSSRDKRHVSPKIVINVGQVRERQMFPLNRYLLTNKDDLDLTVNVNRYSILKSLKQEKFIGSLISDDLMLKRYVTDKITEEITANNINDFGGTDAATISRMRFNNQLNNNLEELNYPKDDISTDLALASLTTFAMNEASQWIDVINPSGSATNQDNETLQFMNSVGQEIQRYMKAEDGSVDTMVNPYENVTKEKDETFFDIEIEKSKDSSVFYDIELKESSKKTDIDSKDAYIENNTDKVSTINGENVPSINTVKEALNALYSTLMSNNSTSKTLMSNLKNLKKTQEDLLNEIYGSDIQSAANSEDYIRNIKIKANIYNIILDRLSFATSDPTLINMINEARISDYGTYESVATNPDVVAKDRISEIGEMLEKIADDVYNNKDIISMAVSEREKAIIADNIYDKILDEMSRATKDPLLKELISRYQMEKQKYSSTATTGKIQGFSSLNN